MPSRYWRTGIRTPVPGPLHASGGYLQPPPHLLGGWPSYLPLEGLCTRQQEAQNDSYSRRIPAPLSDACITAWFCAHPSLRLSGGTTAARVDSGLPPSSGTTAPPTTLSAGSNDAVPHHLAVSVLWQPHDHRGEAHRPADPLEIRRMAFHEHVVEPHYRGPNSMPRCNQPVTCVCTLLIASKMSWKTSDSPPFLQPIDSFRGFDSASSTV